MSKVPKKLVILFFCTVSIVHAQEKIDTNVIRSGVFQTSTHLLLYKDSLYKGNKQLSKLFRQVKDVALQTLLRQHTYQSTTGIALGAVGIATALSTFAIPITQVGARYATILGGLALTLAGSYLFISGSLKLNKAVDIFNERYNGRKKVVNEEDVSLQWHIAPTDVGLCLYF